MTATIATIISTRIKFKNKISYSFCRRPGRRFARRLLWARACITTNTKTMALCREETALRPPRDNVCISNWFGRSVSFWLAQSKANVHTRIEYFDIRSVDMVAVAAVCWSFLSSFVTLYCRPLRPIAHTRQCSNGWECVIACLKLYTQWNAFRYNIIYIFTVTNGSTQSVTHIHTVSRYDSQTIKTRYQASRYKHNYKQYTRFSSKVLTHDNVSRTQSVQMLVLFTFLSCHLAVLFIAHAAQLCESETF